jgi:hypothetical protein
MARVGGRQWDLANNWLSRDDIGTFNLAAGRAARGRYRTYSICYLL